MTRRRLILAIVAIVPCGVAWWQSVDRLSAEERLLVGTWRLGDGRHWHFWSDRRYAYGGIRSSGGIVTTETTESEGRWFVRDSAIVFDPEPSDLRRSFRQAFRRLGLPDNSPVVATYGLESITTSELVVSTPYQTRETWTRARAD